MLIPCEECGMQYETVVTGDAPAHVCIGSDDDDDDEFTAADRVLMAEHDIDENEYEALYLRILNDTKNYGTLAMGALQKQVIEDIESGMWD
jgi:nicotinamide mononucleotide adenylyltransferase